MIISIDDTQRLFLISMLESISKSAISQKYHLSKAISLAKDESNKFKLEQQKEFVQAEIDSMRRLLTELKSTPHEVVQ